MALRFLRRLFVVFLFTGTLWAATDPFAGTWKLNPAKSKLTDQMKVEEAGPNKYTFIFSADNAETIVADGRDQPGIFGTTFAVTVLSDHQWKVVRKTGGRLAISDVVVRGEVPEQIRKSMELWVGCVAGALTDTEYQQKLAAAGFAAIEIEPTRIYSIDDAKEFLKAAGIDADAVAPQIRDKFMSAFVRAEKPAAQTCCGPTCCAN